ncbi:hypothetical protein [Nocardia sp. NPDC127526]|uniref:hypothetical protein n=1 Tax=Nocardia sp. NPDC127526 TaxID=3345393 RepID=UPI0036445B88
MTIAPKSALKRTAMAASAFALAAGALHLGTAPAYAVAGPTSKYECRDVQTPGSLFPGDEVACTLTVSTAGNDTFTNVVAEVTLPGNTVYQTGGALQGTQKVVFNLGEITKAKSASATLTVMVEGKTPDKTAISSEAVVKGFAPNGAFDTTAASNTLTTTTNGAGQGGGKLTAKEDRASVNTFGRAETPISDLVDAPAGVTPKIELVTSTEPKKGYVMSAIIDNGQKIAWSALCTATAQEKTETFTVKITANGQTVEAKVTVLLGDNVANQGLVQPANCAPKP